MIETLAIYLAIPAVVIAVVIGLIFAGGSAQSRRYRPGRQFEFTPVWFLSAPKEEPAKPGRHQRAVKGAGPILALAKGAVEHAEASAPDLTGGTSERW
jgi:hypothetical protein